MRVGPWSRGPTEEQGEDGTTSSRVRLRGAQGVAEVIQAPVGGAWLCDGPLSSPLACRARFAGCLFAFTAALLALASAAPLPHTCSQIDSTLAGCPPAVTGLTIGHTSDSGRHLSVPHFVTPLGSLAALSLSLAHLLARSLSLSVIFVLAVLVNYYRTH